MKGMTHAEAIKFVQDKKPEILWGVISIRGIFKIRFEWNYAYDPSRSWIFTFGPSKGRQHYSGRIGFFDWTDVEEMTFFENYWQAYAFYIKARDGDE